MKRVIAFGTFDPLHEGHKKFLEQAKEFGYLIVVVSHDEKIQLEKKRLPRQSHRERMEKVRELGIADEVILSEPGDDFRLLEKLNPDIIALGYDQKIPEPLKNKVKKYKIISLEPFEPEIYKSSKIAK